MGIEGDFDALHERNDLPPPKRWRSIEQTMRFSAHDLVFLQWLKRSMQGPSWSWSEKSLELERESFLVRHDVADRPWESRRSSRQLIPFMMDLGDDTGNIVVKYQHLDNVMEQHEVDQTAQQVIVFHGC